MTRVREVRKTIRQVRGKFVSSVSFDPDWNDEGMLVSQSPKPIKIDRP